MFWRLEGMWGYVERAFLDLQDVRNSSWTFSFSSIASKTTSSKATTVTIATMLLLEPVLA